MFQECFKSVSRVFQGCSKGVPRVFQGCSKGVSRIFQGCYLRLFSRRLLQVVFKDIYKDFMVVLRLF